MSKVEEIFDSKITQPRLIELEFYKKFDFHLDLKKITNYCKTLRKKKYGKQIIYLHELKERAIEYSKYASFFDCYIPLFNICEDTQKFRIIFTAESLLKNLDKIKLCQVDATYKLNYHGYPCLIFGASDKRRVINILKAIVYRILIECIVTMGI